MQFFLIISNCYIFDTFQITKKRVSKKYIEFVRVLRIVMGFRVATTFQAKISLQDISKDGLGRW